MSEPSKANRWIYLLFSLAVTAGIFTYLLTHVALADVVDLIRNVDRRIVMLFVFLSLSMSVFRTWRYQILLKLSGYRPGTPALFLVVLVRNFFSDLLPARIGSLIYIYLVTSRLGVPGGAATSSFALAFLFDLIALVPLIVLAAWFAGAVGHIPVAGLIGGGGLLALVTVTLLLILPRCFDLAKRWLHHLAFIPLRWREKGEAMLAEAGEDTCRAKDSGYYLRLLVLSVMVRATKYASLYTFLYALLKPLGYALKNMPPSRVFLGLCASEAAASTPVSGIAGFGAYEGTWAMVFTLLGFPEKIARLTSISHHLFTQIYGYLLGAVALVVLLLPLFKGESIRLAEVPWRENSLSFYGKVGAALVLMGLVFWYLAR